MKSALAGFADPIIYLFLGGFALAPALQGQSVYRIRADLAQDFVLAYGEKQPLMAGMQFEADIVQEKRRIFEWMVEPLFSIREKWGTHAE